MKESIYTVTCDAIIDTLSRYQSTLFVAKSSVPNAGYGVFTKTALQKGTTVSYYIGIESSKAQGDYLLTTSKGGIDPEKVLKLELPSGEIIANAARYINDFRISKNGVFEKKPLFAAQQAIHIRSQNVEFGRRVLPASSTMLAVAIRTIRHVQAGDELYIYYGAEF
jgi:hypothetical protein